MSGREHIKTTRKLVRVGEQETTSTVAIRHDGHFEKRESRKTLRRSDESV